MHCSQDAPRDSSRAAISGSCAAITAHRCDPSDLLRLARLPTASSPASAPPRAGAVTRNGSQPTSWTTATLGSTHSDDAASQGNATAAGRRRLHGSPAPAGDALPWPHSPPSRSASSAAASAAPAASATALTSAIKASVSWRQLALRCCWREDGEDLQVSRALAARVGAASEQQQQRRQYLNAIHVSAALSRLAKLPPFNAVASRGPERSTSEWRRSRGLATAVATTSGRTRLWGAAAAAEEEELLSDESLSRLCAFTRWLVRRAEEHLPDMGPRAVANILWALSRLHQGLGTTLLKRLLPPHPQWLQQLPPPPLQSLHSQQQPPQPLEQAPGKLEGHHVVACMPLSLDSPLPSPIHAASLELATAWASPLSAHSGGGGHADTVEHLLEFALLVAGRASSMARSFEPQHLSSMMYALALLAGQRGERSDCTGVGAGRVGETAVEAEIGPSQPLAQHLFQLTPPAPAGSPSLVSTCRSHARCWQAVRLCCRSLGPRWLRYITHTHNLSLSLSLSLSNTHTHTLPCTITHADIRPHAHQHTHTSTREPIHALMSACLHACAHPPTHPPTRTRTHTHAYTHTSRMHTRTHTFTTTLSLLQVMQCAM